MKKSKCQFCNSPIIVTKHNQHYCPRPKLCRINAAKKKRQIRLKQFRKEVKEVVDGLHSFHCLRPRTVLERKIVTTTFGRSSLY